jgi:Nidogen-like
MVYSLRSNYVLRTPWVGLLQRNTFQMALVTDYVNTYVVYNYFNVTWAGSNVQGCDPATGQASVMYPNCKPAQVCFSPNFLKTYRRLIFVINAKPSQSVLHL